MAHVAGTLHLPFIMKALRRHIRVTQLASATLRLLYWTSANMDHLQEKVECAAICVAAHPTDASIAYFAAHIVIGATAIEPTDICQEYGQFGLDAVTTNTIRAAMSCRVVNFHVGMLPWQTHILEKIYPSRRTRE